jgi:hypothetical protein
MGVTIIQQRHTHMPWQSLMDADWLIVGMNHYRMAGEIYLYCAMMKNARCIVSIGIHQQDVFSDLWRQAQAIEDTL